MCSSSFRASACSPSPSRPRTCWTRSTGWPSRRRPARTRRPRCVRCAARTDLARGVTRGQWCTLPRVVRLAIPGDGERLRAAEPASETSGRPKEIQMAAKLYVGGLSYSTTSETLREYFAQCGTVESASVVTDKFSGQSRGFGFVEMATAEEAQRAIAELNGKELDGRKITVNVSNPRAPGSGGGRGGGGPGGGGRPGGGRGGGGFGGGDRGAYGVPPSKKPFRW